MSPSSLKNKNILLVNTGSPKKRFILSRLKKLGVRLICLNKEICHWGQPYIDQWIVANNANHDESLRAVDNFLTSNPFINKFDGCLTFWEDDVILTAKMVDHLGLIGIPYPIAAKVRNKYLFRDFCQQNDLPCPKHHILSSSADLNHVVDTFHFPVVLKPAYGSSSAFVIQAKNKKELHDSYEYIKANISTKIESALEDGLDIFVEEYLDGDETDIDMLIQNGKTKFATVSDNFDKSKGAFFQDSGQAIPSSLPEESQEKLQEMAELVLEKLGIFNGCIHFEAKYTKNGPFPIEVNLRMGGDYVYSYNKTAWNIDLIEYAVKIAIGEYFKIEQKGKPRKYVIGWDLHPDFSGILTELDMDESVEKEKFFEECDLYKELGDPVLVPPEGYDSLGWLTVSGDNPLDVRDNLKKVLEKIHFKVVRYDSESSIGKTQRKDKFSVAKFNKQGLLTTSKLAKIKKITKQDLKNLKIGIVANLSSESQTPVDREVSQSAIDVQTTLTQSGYSVRMFELTDCCSLLNELKASDIDILLNLAKKVNPLSYDEARIASILDCSGIPYTGSDVFPITVAKDKITFKKLLVYHHIPTPDWDYLFSPQDEINEELEFPLIVKPTHHDYSLGISQESVVQNKEQLYLQVEKILKRFGAPVLIEKYIEGDEYSVIILGNDEDEIQILPLSRIIFDKLPNNYWHILSYDVKWGLDTKFADVLVLQNPASKISRKLEKLITEIALDAYTITRCKDFGQVDIKVDDDNNPYVLELNTNPFLSLHAGITKAAKVIKMDHIAMLEEIILMAINRYKANT